MLAFYLNNKPFLLDENTSIRLTWINPVCQFKDFPGDVGLGITIPVNDVNRALLGNPERFEAYSKSGKKEFPAFEVRFKGVRLMSGTLVVNSASNESYGAWLRSEVGTFGEQHREKYIYDIDAFNADVVWQNKANYNPLVDAYGCPKIYNRDFFKDKGRKISVEWKQKNPDWYEGCGEEEYFNDKQETEAFTEAFRKSAAWHVNYLNADNTVKAISSSCKASKIEDKMDICVVSPMLFLNYVVKTLLKDANFFIDNNCIADDPDMQKLLIYNNFDITNLTFDTYTSEPIGRPDWNGTEFVARTVEITDITRDYTTPFRYKDLLPKERLKNIIMGISNELNVAFHFKRDGKVDIIDREKIFSGTTVDISKYLVGNWSFDEKRNVTLKFKFTHDSNDTMFQERWDDIDDRRDDEKDPVANWEALDTIENPDIGEVRYLTDLNIYVEYQLIPEQENDPKDGSTLGTESLGWQYLSSGFQNGFYNRGESTEETIETCFSTLQGQTPMALQAGNVTYMKLAYQNFSPRLLFYTGNNRASSFTDTLALDWEKSNIGLLAKRWPLWNRFWANCTPATREAQVPLNVLDYMIQNITKEHRSQEGEFIIDKIETEFGLYSMSTTKIKAYKQ